MKTKSASQFVFILLLVADVFFGITSRADIVVGNPPTGGLPDGVIISGGTQTTNAEPVRFDVFPITIGARLTGEVARQKGMGLTLLPVRGEYFANLAMGRAPNTPLAPAQIIALAVGNNSPASHRLIVFDRATSTQAGFIARLEKDDISQNAVRKIGLFKITFIAGGGTAFNIGGGSLQLVSDTFASRRAMSIIASGNGALDFTADGIARRSVVALFTLQAASDSVGSFIE